MLLVEDDEDSCFLISEGLTQRGATMLTAATGAEALDVLAKQRPDVLISDLELPDMHGTELMKRVRDCPGFENMPSIALTGHSGDAQRQASSRAGFAKHLLKPTKLSDIMAAILALEPRAERGAGAVPSDIRELLAQVGELSPCRFTSLLRFTADNTLSSVWTHDRENPEIDPFPLGLPIEASYCVLVREAGATWTTEDARTDPRTANHPKREELATYIGVPLRRRDGQMFGTVCSYDPRPLQLVAPVRDAVEKAAHELEGPLSALLGLDAD